MFKICNTCKISWQTKEALLNDPEITLIGYQANFNDILSGLFLFNHIKKDGSCNSTIAIPTKEFLDLYDGEIYPDVKFGGDECEGHCLNVSDLDKCNASCAYAFIRDIMRVIIEKHRASSPLKVYNE